MSRFTALSLTRGRRGFSFAMPIVSERRRLRPSSLLRSPHAERDSEFR